MIKTIFKASLLAVTLPTTSFALGLGEMKVSSYLDQPFYAEIALIDIGNTSLALIKPEFATQDTYERMGLTRSAVVSMLQINIAKGVNGKPVIQITSKDHITDPFIDLVIDLGWPQGQSYKEYTVLLDPPNYALQEKRAPLVEKPERYNRVAAIDSSTNVAAPESPVDTRKLYARDSVDSAAPKVATPPPSSFQENSVQELQSTLIPITSNSPQEAPLNAFVPSIPAMQVAGKPESLQLASRESVNGVGHWANTELSVASAAVDSMRESNFVLNEQMQSLQAQNKKLQLQLDTREKELTQLRNQLDILIKTKSSVGAQVHSSSSQDSEGYGLFWLLFIIATGGAGFLFWHFKKQQPEQLQAFIAKSNDFVKKTVPQWVPKNKEETSEKETPILTPIVSEAPKEPDTITQEQVETETKPLEETSPLTNNLHQEVLESTPAEEVVPKEVLDSAPPEENFPESFDFHTEPSTVELEETSKHEVPQTTEQEPLEFSFENKNTAIQPMEESNKEEPLFTTAEPIEEEQVTIEPESTVSLENEASQDSNTVEFETGLYKHQETTIEKEPIALSEELVQSLEINKDLKDIVENNPLKSEKALDTLLDLAKTYIGMGDTEAAKHSLEEVLEYGSEAQKAQAKAILDEIG